jgi:hypothetical protein
MSFIGNLFNKQKNVVFPAVNPNSGVNYYDTFTGGFLNSGYEQYGPFFKVYIRGSPATGSVLENVDWTSFPTYASNATSFPIVVGTKLSKAKSLNRLLGTGSIQCLTTDKKDAYVVTLGATIDVIHFTVNSSSADYELTFVDRHQITPTGTILTGDSVVPEHATVDDDGNLYTLRWMRTTTSYQQRIEIVKYDVAGNVLWRNDDWDNDFDPEGGLGLGPIGFAWSLNNDVTSPYWHILDGGDWYDYRILYAHYATPNLTDNHFGFRLTQELSLGWAHKASELSVDWEISTASDFSSVTDSGNSPNTATEASCTLSVQIETTASNLGAWPWPAYSEEPAKYGYIRYRINDGVHTSVWTQYSVRLQWAHWNSSLDYATAGPADLTYSGALPTGYRWRRPQASGSLLQISNGELVLAYGAMGYHYTNGVMDNDPDPDHAGTVRYAGLFMRFSLTDGSHIATEYGVAPTPDYQHKAWPMRCMPVEDDGKYYVYGGRASLPDGYYYLVDIRTIATGVWTHVEWAMPAGGQLGGSWGHGKMYVIAGQPMIIDTYHDICAMRFTSAGYQGIDVVAINHMTAYPTLSPFLAMEDFTLSYDNKKMYVASYYEPPEGGYYVVMHCLPAPMVQSNAVWFQLI